MKGEVVFDDGVYRDKTLLLQKKIVCYIYAIPWIMCAAAAVVGFSTDLYYKHMSAILAMFGTISFVTLALLPGLYEYFKVKNGHLIITREAIYITNWLNKTTEYLLDYKELSLEILTLKEYKNANSPYGTILSFYDKNGEFLLKYKNWNSNILVYDSETNVWKWTDFGELIKSLQIPIVREEERYRR